MLGSHYTDDSNLRMVCFFLHQFIECVIMNGRVILMYLTDITQPEGQKIKNINWTRKLKNIHGYVRILFTHYPRNYYHSLGNSALVIHVLFLFFPENRLWHFIQIVSLRRQFAWKVRTYILGKVGKIIQILVCFTQHAQYVHVSGLHSEVQFTRECFFFPGPLLLLALFIRYHFALLNAAQVFPKPIPTFPSQKSLGFSSFEVKCITNWLNISYIPWSLACWVKTSADNILKYFSYFFQKTGFDISCKTAAENILIFVSLFFRFHVKCLPSR